MGMTVYLEVRAPDPITADDLGPLHTQARELARDWVWSSETFELPDADASDRLEQATKVGYDAGWETSVAQIVALTHALSRARPTWSWALSDDLNVLGIDHDGEGLILRDGLAVRADSGEPDPAAQATLEHWLGEAPPVAPRGSECDPDADEDSPFSREAATENPDLSPPAEEPVMPTFHAVVDVDTAPSAARFAWLVPSSLVVTQRDDDLIVTGVLGRVPDVFFERIAIELTLYSARGECILQDDYGIDAEPFRGELLPFRRSFTARPEVVARAVRAELRVLSKLADLAPPVRVTFGAA